MPAPSPEQRLLSSLAAHLGNPARVRAYELEDPAERPLDRRGLLALLDDLEAAGWLTSELLVRVTPAGRAVLGAGELAAAELRIT
jgi:hypothetical protein